MMAKYNLTWQQTDAQLPDVLLMADAIDGTVFSLKEVEQALEKRWWQDIRERPEEQAFVVAGVPAALRAYSWSRE